MARFNRNLAAFVKSAEGSIAVTGAIAAVPILVGIAGLASYANAVSVKQQTQAAADAAALAATTAYLNERFNGGYNDYAEELAQNYFLMNAPATAIQGKTSLTAKLTVTNSTVSTAVNYCGNQPSLFSSLVGGSTNVCSSATSSAPVKTAQEMRGDFLGTGEIWGDPHIFGASGQRGQLACADGKWTRIFSDAQIQVNAQCVAWGTGGSLTENVIGDVAITIGAHRMYIQSNYTQAAGWGSIFTGVVTVDGVTVTPQAAGSYPLLNDPLLGVTATDEYWYPNSGPVATVAGGLGANYVEVKSQYYDLIVSFNAYTVIVFSATHAGACAAPTGALGQTYNFRNTMDWNGADFETPGNDPWYLDPIFSQTCNLKTVHHVQGRAVISQ